MNDRSDRFCWMPGDFTIEDAPKKKGLNKKEKQLLDECYKRALKLGRRFEEKEVFKPAWDEGYELTPAMDKRFVVVKETKKQLLYGLKGIEYKAVTVINDNRTASDKIEQQERKGWKYGSSKDIYGPNDLPDENDYTIASNVRLYFWREKQ